VIAKKKIAQGQVEKLVAGKKTDLIKGFKSKAGNSFDAYLVIDQRGMVSFEFK
jgi:DNA topoisomerase-3